MKWFKVDSDTPHDPRIQDVLHKHGNAGLGALIRLWCFIATHGQKRIGWSVDSRGKPIAISHIRDAVGLTEPDFDLWLSDLVSNGHVARKPWEQKSVIAIPAMSKRSDTYSQRRVRTVFAQKSPTFPLEEIRREEKIEVQERRYSGATAPRKKSSRQNGKDPYPVVLKIASDLLGRIPVKKPVELASLKEDVKRRCATLHIPYEGDVVGRAVESALAVRAKVGEKR